MQRFQVQRWGDSVLLLLNSLQSTWFHWHSFHAGNSLQVMWIWVYCIAQISLRAQLHWAMLGICQAPLLIVPTNIKVCRYGEKCQNGTGVHSDWVYVTVRSFLEQRRLELSKMPCRFSNQSSCFIDAYHKGLNGKQAAWTSKRYRGHQVLPESILKELDEAHII